MAHPFTPAQQALFLNHQPAEALSALAPHLTAFREGQLKDAAEIRFLITLAAMAHQESGQYGEAARLYESIGDDYSAGYAHLLMGNIDATRAAWTKVAQRRPNHWCVSLFGMVTGNPNSIPTFLQIRNHLEADILLLAAAGQTKMVQNIVFALEFLAGINYESYKYAGRALFHSGLLSDVEAILLKGQKILPADPEVYYHLGQYYAAVGRTPEAKSALQQCLMISGTYTPAQALLESLG